MTSRHGSDQRSPGERQLLVSIHASGRAAGARRLKRLRIAMYIVVTVVLAILVVLAPRIISTPPPDGPDPELIVTVRSAAGETSRVAAARVGDILVLDTTWGRFPHGRLRVYLDEQELVLSCDVEAPCERTESGIRATVAMSTAGTYQPALFLSDGPIPEPGAGLDEDNANVLANGGRVWLDVPVEVR